MNRYKIFEGRDHLHATPLYQVTGVDNDYVGEWYTNKDECERELASLVYVKHLAEPVVRNIQTAQKIVDELSRNSTPGVVGCLGEFDGDTFFLNPFGGTNAIAWIDLGEGRGFAQDTHRGELRLRIAGDTVAWCVFCQGARTIQTARGKGHKDNVLGDIQEGVAKLMSYTTLDDAVLGRVGR